VGSGGVLIICQQGFTSDQDCPGKDASHWSDILRFDITTFIGSTVVDTFVTLLSDPNTPQTDKFCDEFMLVHEAVANVQHLCIPASVILDLNSPFGHATEDAKGCVCGFPIDLGSGQTLTLDIHSDTEVTTHGVPEFSLPAVALAAITLCAFAVLAVMRSKLYNTGPI
jgi:hypothetical protein